MVPQHIVAVGILSTLEAISSCRAHLPRAAAQRCGKGDVQAHEHISGTRTANSLPGEAGMVNLLSSEKMMHVYGKCMAYSRTTFG